MRFRKELESDVYRDMVYGLHCMLGFDKLQKETELEKRLAELENKGGLMLNISTAFDAEGRPARIAELLAKAGYEPPGPTKTGEYVGEPDTCKMKLQGSETQPRRLKL
jgi:hypothetical protein